MPGISGDDGKCHGRRAGQGRVNGGFVLERDLAERCRQCEDDMKVRHRQQLGLPIRKPFWQRQSLALGTVTVAARVVSDARCATIITPLDMAPEHRRPARRDGTHDPSLDAPEAVSARLSKGFAMAAEDIRHLQSLSHGTRLAGRTTSKRSRSSGFGVWLIVLVATRV
jgi:hypothetical protein